MKYRRLTDNGDYTFGNGVYDYCSDAEAVGQAVKTKLLLLKNEWWEDLNDGTYLFQGILLQSGDERGKEAIDLVIKSRILSLEEVDSIIEFKSFVNRKARSYTTEVTIKTIFGVVVQSLTMGG